MTAGQKTTGQVGDLTGDGGLGVIGSHDQGNYSSDANELQARAAAAIRGLLKGAPTNGTDPATLGPWAETWATLAAAPDLAGRQRVFDALARDDPGLARLVAGDPSEPEHLTDLGNAARLVRLHGADLRYCYPWARWLAWDGRRWAVDDSGEVARRAKATVKAIFAEAARADDDTAKELGKHALKCESAQRIAAMLTLAQSEPEIPVRPRELDASPWLLNLQNGTLDLRTGALRAHDRADLLTKFASVIYDPAATCPTWDAFLTRVMGGDGELIGFLQRVIGYSLTGDTSEQAVFILYGTGANGKSTFLETIRTLLGDDYARQVRTETLMDTNRGTGPTEDLARLKGARFVSARETEEGKRLAEALVKELSGGDTLTARFLYAESFEYRPSFKLFLGANHKPVIRGTDYAIWRRIRLVPFAVTIPPDEQDHDLARKLEAELPGILAWAVRGCLAWQAHGLGTPAAVTVATEAYRAESDVLSAFLTECTVSDPKGEVQAGPLYAAYTSWCEDNGEKHVSGQIFGRRLIDRGLDKYIDRARHTFYLGLTLPKPTAP